MLMVSLSEVHMRLSRQHLFLVLASVAIGCADSTAPDPTYVSYSLESVNGQPLPAVIRRPIPEESITVVSATLNIYSNDRVTWVEHQRELSGNGPVETIFTRHFTYHRDGNSVELHPFPCPDAVCVGYTGVIIDSKLHFNVGLFSPTDPITYVFGFTVVPLV